MNKILKTCKYVVDNSEHVEINRQKVNDFSNYFSIKHIKHWISESAIDIYDYKPKDRLHLLLVINSLSFSYWGTPKWTIKYKGKEYDGAFGMVSSIKRALEGGYPLLDPIYLSNMRIEDLEKVLEGNTQIPLLKERLDILNEIGTVLVKRYDGDFTNLVKKSNKDSQKLLSLIVADIPSFDDSSVYKEKKVYFHKRAQILIADIYQSFPDHEFGNLYNIDKLTACADYKLPFVLRRLEILSYSDYLANKVDNRIVIEKDSNEEVELRANTIWVIDLIRQRIKDKVPNAYPIHINDHIWMLSQSKLETDKPYHLTRTTSY